MVLFGGVGFGVWLNAERLSSLRRDSPVQRIDQTGTLSDEQKAMLAAYAKKFLDAYGLTIVIRIQNEAFPETILSEAERARTVFLGLSLAPETVRLEVPPLAASALGEPFIAYLREEHFPPYFARGEWPKGLASALSLMAEKLDAAVSGRKRGGV